ncbi:MAG: MFS transporter [Dehalococcoidia bacterium]
MRARLRRPFYGWYIVGAAVGVQGMVSALMFQAFGTYVVLLERDFGWSRTSLAAAFSFARIEDGLLGPLQGWLLDRVGPRWVMRVGFVLFGLGLFLFSRLDSLFEFYATYILMAIGAALAGFLSITTAIVNWFERRRSFAMGLALLGAPVGGLALPFVVSALETYGWRPVAAASGVIVIVFGLPLAQVVRRHPSDLGLRADGDPPIEVTRDLDGNEPEPSEDLRVFTAREALATRAFWFISLAHAAAVLVVSVVQVHFVAHVNESLGYSLTQAAAMLTLMTILNLVGRVGGGYLGDRINTRNVLIGAMLMHAAALLFLTFAQSLWMLIAFAVLNGLAWGSRVPLIISMRADYFGARSYGTIMGFSSIVVTLGSISGPVLAGISYDQTGSYTIGFTALAILAGLGSLFLWFLPAPQDARRATVEAAS